ncbi:protein Aster-B-like isoform X1 [Danaus plexippus]|uniref:protein Aster-B-like isoform X1 n=1 Tax=Danaus plexippus TaxID=13037 RepID=UPI000239E883|nr:protein Aster-B-like isoform X1 [Danaus plexippus]
MTTWKTELENRNIAVSMRKSVENLVISSQDAIGQSISQALSFSGVVTNATATLQENKNVSRSPSPSLRHAESSLDFVDNDRKSDVSDTSQVPSVAGDVALGLDAASLLIKDVKAASPSSRGDQVRSKKKSWYNSLYPTYKSKCDDFKRLFKELPDDERLIVDYSCALQCDILVHGRLYASQRHLCFHANIFGWEKVLMLRWTDVTAITKEKTARVIPNAILICTETEKNFLASFTGRDKAYLMLFRIWQNALMDQPMSSHEILQLVHACYGAELGFDSDEDAHDAQDPQDPNEQNVDVSEEAVDSSSMEAAETRATPYQTVTNGNAEFREEAGDVLPTDMSDSSDSEPEKHNSNGEDEKCTSSHEGKLLLQQEFPINIDQLFTMIFTNSKFNLELLAARDTSDYVQNPWQPQNGLKCRQVSYTLGLTSGPMGPKEVQVTETQVMNRCSKPGVLYSIDCSNENAGIPYADYFSVEAHYCLRRRGDRTALELYGYVNYKKTMWPLIKAFLEKNAMSGIEEFARLLESRLMAAARPVRPARPPPALQARSRRRRRGDVTPLGTLSAATTLPAGGSAAASGAPAGRAGTWLTAALLVLLALNALLYWRLYHAERRIDLEHLHTRMNTLSESQAASWARALESHSARQRGQLMAWRSALDRTVTHLLQTEQALKSLLETIKPALEKADGDTEPRDEL